MPIQLPIASAGGTTEYVLMYVVVVKLKARGSAMSRGLGGTRSTVRN
jgi:hypothetical protein